MRAPYRYLAAPVIVTVGLSGTLAGCANVTAGKPAAEGSGAAHGATKGKGGSRSAGSNYDISRLSAIQNDFLPEQTVRVEPPRPLGDQAAGFANLAYGDSVIDPPGCATMTQPVRPGPDAQASVAVGSGVGLVFVAAVKSPKPLPDSDTGEACTTATMTQTYKGRTSESTLTALTAPHIDGVRTTGTRDETTTGRTKSYVYAAFLSDTVAVAVWGMLSGNPREQAILEELLVKAVESVRG